MNTKTQLVRDVMIEDGARSAALNSDAPIAPWRKHCATAPLEKLTQSRAAQARTE